MGVGGRSRCHLQNIHEGVNTSMFSKGCASFMRGIYTSGGVGGSGGLSSPRLQIMKNKGNMQAGCRF